MDETTVTGQVRVATLNLWGRRGEWEERRRLLAEGFRELEPDLNVTPKTDDFACGAIIAEVFAPEPVGTLLFVNHLPNWQLTHEHERELQTAIVGRAIEEIAERRGLRHVVLAGDLDATPDAASMRQHPSRRVLPAR